jgi:hypothetical protein
MGVFDLGPSLPIKVFATQTFLSQKKKRTGQIISLKNIFRFYATPKC